MATIPIFQRQELPPTQVGAAKPSFSLADQSGLIGAGEAIAGISEKVWSELTTAKVANEKAIFLGAEKTARANLNSFIVENPFASEAEIRTAQGKMIQEIEKAGQSSSLPEVQQYAKNWIAVNKETLLIKSGDEITEIVKQREQERFNLQMESLEKSTEPSSLQEGLTLIDNQTGTLIDPEISEIFKEVYTQTKTVQFEKIRLAQEKAVIEIAKEALLTRIQDMSPEDAFKEIDADEAVPFDEKKGVRAEYGVRRNMLANEVTRIENERKSENEKATYKEYNEGSLTPKGLNEKLFADEIGPDLHATYKGLIEDKSLKNTDSILAEKWLNNTLTIEDIKQAQKEGRLLNSNVVASWKARIDTGEKFNVGVYDSALIRIREVRTDKTKYDGVRLWLLQNAKELGFQWDDTRNRLETAMSFKPKAENTPHVSRAHKLIDQYAKNNPRINDGTINSIRRIQLLHDAIDAREDFTPAQMRDLTQALLLPFEEEEAKGWISAVFGAVTKFGPLPILIRGTKKVRAERQKILNSIMLIQPVSKDEFKTKINDLKTLFGDDSKEARLFYDKYVDSYDWEIE